jgi:RNA polymerase sigma factor (sigma-70 family)
LTLLQQGNEAAFKELVDTCEDMVYNTVVSLVQHEDAADDITQEVFIQAFRSASSFKGESQLSTWLYRIAVNKALDYEKQRKRQKRGGLLQRLWGHEAEAAELPDFHHPGILLEQKEAAAQLFRSLRQLPDKQRIAFTLHKLEGLGQQQIADIMGTTVTAVESLVGRAKAGLRKELENFYIQSKR